MRTIAVCLALLLTLLAPALQGAIVQFAGVINNDAGGQISQWRTAGTPKTLDADGDNLYGTTARLFYTIAFVGEGSLYQFNSSDDQVGPFSGYAVVDHPTGGADLQVRTTTNNGAAGQNEVMFTFTALAGSPTNVRIGIATDGLDGAQYSPASIGLRQVNGGGSSAEHTLTAVNNTLDMVFFDVTGVQAGDQFQVFGDTGGGGFATHQFVTWDAIPPIVVVNNLANAPAFTEPLADSTIAAAHSFITGSQDVLLTSVSAFLQRDAGNAQAQFSIRTNNGSNKPGAIVETLGNTAVFTVSGTKTVNASGQTLLAANTRYWLVVKNVAGSFSWHLTTSNANSGTGTLLDDDTRSTDGGLTWPAVNGANDYHLFNVAGSVPPPVVTTTADEDNGSRNLTAGGGAGVSLREAVKYSPAGALITFAPGLSGQTITLTHADGTMPILQAVTIDASALPGGLTISGGGTKRIFTVSSGQTVALQNLTLTAGYFAGDGGAILNQSGLLTLTRCTLSGNTAHHGAAILSDGTLTLTQCTLSGNTASNGFGGAIYTFGGTLTLTQCTLSGNTASARGGAIYNIIGNTTLANSIVSGNTSPIGADIRVDSGTVTKTGANLVQALDNQGSLNGSGTINNAAPLLAPLGNYGGPTQTMALLPGSPARNTAVGSLATSDQRGFPIVSTPDIGAYEAGTFTNFNAWIYETLPVNATVPQHAATFDYDGDGVTNTSEWAALTDPTSAASIFRITSAVRSGPNVILTFPSVSGRTYTLWQSDTLSGTWTNTNQTAITGNGSPKTFTIPAPVPGIPKRFHRVQAGP